MITTRRERGHRMARAGCRAGGSIRHSHRERPREHVSPPGGRLFFSGQISQHMRTGHRLADWLAAGAMVLAVASWGMLVSLLGS
jgi:hypothetical protein